MAKLSLSWAINRKKRIRIATGLAVLLLLFAGISMMVSQNPRGTKALNVLNLQFNNWLINNNMICKANLTAGTELAYCQAGSPPGYVDPKTDAIFDGGTASNFQFVMRGTNTFNSLIIKNNAIVTHERLVATDDFDKNSSDLTPAGRLKKVDLVVVGDITLQTGGKINVDSKGYPGATETVRNCDGDSSAITSKVGADGKKYGMGPGGGLSYKGDEYYYGGGGGFGGEGLHGGYGTDGRSGIGSWNYDYLIPGTTELYFGSGGGSGYLLRAGTNDVTELNGGPGGGRIKIKANSIIIDNTTSTISANGGNATSVCWDGWDVGAGGGSGGAIYVEATNIIMYSIKDSAIRDGGNFGGSPGIANVPGFAEAYFRGYFSVLGGVGYYDSTPVAGGPGGGGGWLVVKKIVDQQVTIKKVLEPMERAGVANTTFNPYALQKGDKIRVKLYVTNISPGDLTITDEMLRVPYGSSSGVCLGTGVLTFRTFASSKLPTAPDYKWTWTDDNSDPLSPRGTSEVYSYACIVQ